MYTSLTAPAQAVSQPVSASAGFKKQVIRVIFAIVLFIFVYLILVAAGLTFAALCVYYGAFLAISLKGGFAIVAGLGLMAMGISLVYFLFKFMFASSKDEKASRVQINEKDQPRLFAFIRQLTREVAVPFPGKIFVSPEVNAAVFYNSNFFSMFFPVRKNLEIGLGLVNSLNESEFKAVMAHEFGHFSQRSMKLGVFTFNVNKIIWNMLYENEGYHSFLQFWARGGNVTLLLARLTLKITHGIQWVLRQMYKIVNKSNLALSREMEFHADAVAASVCGGNNLVSALMQIQVASECYDKTLDLANQQLQTDHVFKNMYSGQSLVFRELGKEKKFSVENDLPRVSDEFMQASARTRINFSNQWASHPTFTDRKMELERRNIYRAPVTGSAWHLFDNADRLQEEMTAKIYAPVDFKEKTPQTMDSVEIETILIKEKSASALPEVYNGFYDARYPGLTEDELSTLAALAGSDFPTLFSEEHCALPALVRSNESDLQLLRAIAAGQTSLDSFDFDGVKYKKAEAETLIPFLEADIGQQEKQLHELDLQVFAFFLHRKPQGQNGISDLYHAYARSLKEFRQFSKLHGDIYSRIGVLYKTATPFTEISRRIREFRSDEEPLLKAELLRLLGQGTFSTEGQEDLSTRARAFAGSNYIYFQGKSFFDEEMQELKWVMDSVLALLNSQTSVAFRKMVVDQLLVANP